MKSIMQAVSNTVPLTISNGDVYGNRRGAVSGQDSSLQPQVQHSLLRTIGIQRLSPCRQLGDLQPRLALGIQGRPRSDAVCFEHRPLKAETEFSLSMLSRTALPPGTTASLAALAEDPYGSFDDAIQFIKLVRQFKNNPNRTNAHEAFSSCIQSGAKFPVNVPSQVKRKLEQHELAKNEKGDEILEADIFDTALMEVLKLLKQGLTLNAGQEERSEKFTQISQKFLIAFQTIDEKDKNRNLKNLSLDGQNDSALLSVDLDDFLNSFDGWDYSGTSRK